MSAVATFLITFVATLMTFNYYTLVERLVLKVNVHTAAYADGVALLLTYFASFLLLQYIAILLFDEYININPIVNGLAGAVFGALACTMFTGILVIAWLMLPGSVYFRDPDLEGAKVTGSVDEKVLTVVRFVANDRIKGKVPFDPEHVFMRVVTNKFVKPPKQPEREGFERVNVTGGGDSSRPSDLRRSVDELDEDE